MIEEGDEPQPLVTVRDDGRVRIITLNRPQARNALSTALRMALIERLKEAEADPKVGAVVLTGAGTVFAAGADLQEMADRSSAEQRAFLQPPHIYSVVEGLRKPVVAALNGHALGAGLELATSCDVRIMGEHAKMGSPEIGLALIPGGGGTQRLSRLIGPGWAARLVFTGEAIPALEALRLRLVDAVVGDDRVVMEAVRLAAAMARHDGEALAAAKRALQAAWQIPYAEGLKLEIEEFVRLHGREEAKGRLRSFLEKPGR
ncbi:MAG: enoyl-CoA hydratase/isomerase family protein [Thermoplasmatota archaeon]